ncbi:MAG: wax ester/triacylglycerol synthase family O-acyltransferase [Hahellaceae bacterium]|nr:wax ester/triacylglycerol synthase family O-acyltransferase [Hahellaceae bacterium]MCP5168856.1 wax ester/triacylglycerol synthase family O-acyltransferase [Hahellaceae bacterium]
MRQLSDLDASFLYLESERTPMIIGGLYVFDTSERNTDVTFEEFSQFIAARVHLAPFFRQRLVEVPLKLDHPYWIDDPEFQLGRHLTQLTLQPGDTETSLNKFAADLFARPLERDRPLWSITYVDGLEHLPESSLPARGFAMIVRLHHAAIDSLSGDEIMSTLLDFSVTPRKLPPTNPWRPEPLPSKVRLLSSAYGNAITSPFKLATFVKGTAASAFYTLLIQKLRNINIPVSLFSAPRTLFNKNVNQSRQLEYIELPLKQLKQLRKSIGGEVTINDVVTGICAEALYLYLNDQNELPTPPLIAMTPISVRSKTLKARTGNQLSAMLISLATNIRHPIVRIRKIHDNAIISENYSQAISADRLTELVPSSIIALSTRIYTEFQLAQRHKPLFNLPITNIPGPQTPLYLNGAKLVRQVGTAPLFDGIGLVLVAVSYDGKVNISVTSCPTLLEDKPPFGPYLMRAVEAIDSALQEPFEASEYEEAESTREQGAGIIDDVISIFSNLYSNLFSREKVLAEKQLAETPESPVSEKPDAK